MELFKFLFQLLAFVLLYTIGTAIPITRNGQPGCKTEEELNTRIYRNFFDPNAYWKCVNLNDATIIMRCPDQTGFLDSLKDCVSWDIWQWEEPVAPPSQPNK